MRYKPFLVGLLLSLLLVGCTLALSLTGDKYKPTSESEMAVTANEIDRLIRSGDTQAASQKAQQLVNAANSAKSEDSSAGLWILCIAAVAVVNICIVFIWISVIKPFHKLERFADSLAAGEFDEALDYQRTNYFGKFTWAFDSMRREIIKARACERAAIDNNKTVIASLSHDLKTPVASISAYSEALVNGLYSNTEEMYSYLDVISSKCAEVAKLTNDMITHSIGELGALKMEPSSIDLCELIEMLVRETAATDVRFERPMFPVRVYADRSRLTQLFGNLIANAQKYAGTQIDISITKKDRDFTVSVRDYGSGIPDDELPFVFDKFYRGSSSQGIEGSGLGLYIVKYVAQRSGGDVIISNAEPGTKAEVILPEEKMNP